MRFSIIIPIYNVKPFIERGFNSIVKQTFQDYEVIFIDDGSTDGSAKLLDELENRYPKVRVFHQKNSGAGPARNLGIDKAYGDYIVFFDIDDILYKNALSRIDEELCKTNTELLIFSYKEINQTYGIEQEFRFEEANYLSNEELRRNYLNKLSGLVFNNGFVWNKVYKRSFIQNNKISFESLRIQQDEVFNLQIYPRVGHTKVISDVLYDYFVYYTTNTRSGKIPERLDIYNRVREAFLQFCNIWQLKDNDFLQYIHNRYFHSLLIHIDDNVYPCSNRRQLLKELFASESVKLSISYLHNYSYHYSFPHSVYLKAAVSNNPTLFIITHLIERVSYKVKCLIRRLR